MEAKSHKANMTAIKLSEVGDPHAQCNPPHPSQVEQYNVGLALDF